MYLPGFYPSVYGWLTKCHTAFSLGHSPLDERNPRKHTSEIVVFIVPEAIYDNRNENAYMIYPIARWYRPAAIRSRKALAQVARSFRKMLADLCRARDRMVVEWMI
jgi:hypothetical protein